MSLRSLFVALTLLHAASAVAGTPRLLVLGDSLSAAYGMDPADGWPALLQRRLDDGGHGYRVVNASISGDTTAGGVRRLPALLAAHAPEIVVIALGGNDGLRGVPLETLRANLDTLVTTAREKARAVLLVGVRMPPNYGPRYSAAFADAFRVTADRHGIALVPALLAGVGEDLALMQDDGIHPRAVAQARLLDNVWPQLEPLLDGGH